MKTNIGIVGYGNLGKALEQVIIAKTEFNLVAIFSERQVKSNFNTLIESYENISLYRDKIDVMLLCSSSQLDIPKQTTEILVNFDCINPFDNHKKILKEQKRLDSLAKTTKHRLIMACGWEPGIFSNIKAMCYAFSGEKPSVFCGKGISIGHSEAIRKIKYVTDGVEFTIPNTLVLKQARRGKVIGNEQLHLHECFVVAEKKYHAKIEKVIKNMPDFFSEQPTSVRFVSKEQLLKLRSKKSHKGEIISVFKTIHGSKVTLDFKLKLASNADFTATVMAKYIDAILNLKRLNIVGAFSPLDIPISFLFKPSARDWMIKELG